MVGRVYPGLVLFDFPGKVSCSHGRDVYDLGRMFVIVNDHSLFQMIIYSGVRLLL